MIAFMRFF